MSLLKNLLVKKLAVVLVALWLGAYAGPAHDSQHKQRAAPLWRWRLCFSGWSCAVALLLAGWLRFGA